MSCERKVRRLSQCHEALNVRQDQSMKTLLCTISFTALMLLVPAASFAASQWH